MQTRWLLWGQTWLPAPESQFVANETLSLPVTKSLDWLVPQTAMEQNLQNLCSYIMTLVSRIYDSLLHIKQKSDVWLPTVFPSSSLCHWNWSNCHYLTVTATFTPSFYYSRPHPIARELYKKMLSLLNLFWRNLLWTNTHIQSKIPPFGFPGLHKAWKGLAINSHLRTPVSIY